MPSRSEGMETRFTRFLITLNTISSTCAFPFGGNGNPLPLPLLFTTSSGSTCAFPFGGNGNRVASSGTSVRSWVGLHVPSRSEGMETQCHTIPCRLSFLYSLHVPSRSEGMETLGCQMCQVAVVSCVYMCLPVRREWKLGGDEVCAVDFKFSLHVPSRSEGMET